MERIIRIFLYSAGVLLLATALAKLVSSFGNAGVLGLPDPVFGIRYRRLFWIAGALELAVASVCFFGRRVSTKALLVAWLGALFLVYRLGLLSAGFHMPCRCLGSLTAALGIPEQSADHLMRFALAYLLVGSCLCLLQLWRHSLRGRRAGMESGHREERG